MHSNQSLVFFDPFSIEEVHEYAMAEQMRQGVLFSPVNVMRVNYQGDRYYCHKVAAEEGQPAGVSDFYPSVTTITRHGKTTGQELFKWYADNGWDNVQKTIWYKRRFGTFLHLTQAELSAKMMAAGDNQVDLAVGDLRNAFVNYAQASGLPQEWIHQYWDLLCKGLISWRLFCIMYEVEFLLIEKTLLNTNHGYAGTVDYVLNILDGPRHTRAGKSHQKYELKSREEAERQSATLDVKSGKNGMYPDGALQLNLLGMAVEQNFGLKCDRLLHYNPTNWRTAPAFNIEDAGADRAKPEIAKELNNLEHVLAIALNRLEDISNKPYKKTVSGYVFGDGGLKRKTLTVREAFEWYVDGRAIELGMAQDMELAAERLAMEQLSETAITTATV